MRCIPCMHCLICVSPGDVWGTVLRYDSLPVLSFEPFPIREFAQVNAPHLRVFGCHNVSDHAEYLAMESIGCQFLFTTKASVNLA